VRGLLAKAEATTFPAEAEAFAAKAQELMAKHSIDAAMLDERHGDQLIAGVRARRFHLEQPYAKEKVMLLATVASVNRVRVVFDEHHAMATAVGFNEDLDATDLLFTSLLVQASSAVSATATNRSSSSGSAAFRRAFWLSYSARIGERLRDAQQRAEAEGITSYGSSLVPLLQERTEAVSARVDQMFANTRPMKARMVDADGWQAGRAAADKASLNAPRARLR
jgi:Protein of unknown function (DUF2786)